MNGFESMGPGGNNNQRLQTRTRVPPSRKTADGTLVNYWCDLPPRHAQELDDGAFNPIWTMSGYTQTFHFWKETRRAQSVPLNTFLTYITLPWWAIAKGRAYSPFKVELPTLCKWLE